MNPTRLLRSLLSERLGQTAGRWPREMFGEMDAPTLRQAIAERVNPSPQSVIEPPAPTRIQPDAGGVQEGFGTTPFYRGAVHDVDTSQGPNQLAFFTPSREFAGEFPRALPAEQRRVGEYRLREDQLADFRNPETQQRVLAELADDADATDHLRRRIAQMRDKATGHIDWVISADPAIRDAIERAGYSGMWLDEGGGQASVAVFRNSDIRPASAQPDGGSAQTGRSLADRVLNVEPAPMQRDGNILRLQDDRGSLQARALDGDSVLRVDSLGIAQGSRGTLGPRVLRALLDEADRTGRVLVSDTRLSADAVRAVESLRRLGLTVTKNPSVTIMPTGSHVAGDFAPLYSITRGPVEWADVQRAYFEPNVRVRAQPNAGGGRNGNGGTVAALTALPAGALTLRELLRDRYGAA